LRKKRKELFYLVTFRPSLSVRVFWTSEEEWFHGIISDWQAETGRKKISTIHIILMFLLLNLVLVTSYIA
jgi:hypothetical protein